MRGWTARNSRHAPCLLGSERRPIDTCVPEPAVPSSSIPASTTRQRRSLPKKQKYQPCGPQTGLLFLFFLDRSFCGRSTFHQRREEGGGEGGGQPSGRAVRPVGGGGMRHVHGAGARSGPRVRLVDAGGRRGGPVKRWTVSSKFSDRATRQRMASGDLAAPAMNAAGATFVRARL